MTSSDSAGSRGPGEAGRDLSREFSGLHAQLKELLTACEQKVDDLPGPFLQRVDLAALYRRLLALAIEGLRVVQKHRSYFSRESLYEDGMFWYDLFQLINAAGGRVWQHGDDVTNVPADIAKSLARVLVDISRFSTATGGDILQRNAEALASTLLAFGPHNLEKDLRKRVRALRLKRVMEFMDETLRIVTLYR